MKAKNYISLLTSIVILLLIFGFSRDKNKSESSGFVFVPTGSTVIHDKTYNLDSYWILDHEVSNKEYNEFLNYLKSNDKESESEIARVHSKNWIDDDKIFKPFIEYYHSHPAYEDYPVLNISYEAAKLYCDWLTSRHTDKTQEYRLPTKIEWIYAAKGGLEISVYSWGRNSLQNETGQTMCNYRRIGDEFIHAVLENNYVIKSYKRPKDNATITSPVNSFWPNEYGLYNTCGNVAEMIAEKGIALGGSWNSPGYDVRIESTLNYEKPTPFVGFRPVRISKN